ncbi:hypothetical protein HK096_011327 [Nowakowskiella sp. JEL0078]|nr:hypothetical protein HK096_011327 [Nowakowskiella sp. JEL0078]
MTIIEPIYPGSGNSPYSCYGTAPFIFAKVVSWGTGVYSGITGPGSTTTQTQDLFTTSGSTSTLTPNPSQSNAIPIIVGVGIAVIVIIASIIGIIFVRSKAKKSANSSDSAAALTYPSLPSEYSQSRYPSGFPTGFTQPVYYQPIYVSDQNQQLQGFGNAYPPLSKETTLSSPVKAVFPENAFISGSVDHTQT